jgi:hypothetical protein
MNKGLAAVISSAFLAGCSVVGIRSGTEQPPYQVIGQINNDIELRQYGERLAAEVAINRRSQRANENSAFSMLAGYIFGNNQTKIKLAMTSPVSTNLPSKVIAMTAPVESNIQDDGPYTMRFFLPETYSLDTAPTPKNSQVKLITAPSETMAAIRFSGRRNLATVDRYKETLMRSIQGSNWKATSDPVAFFYDPPWTAPFLRRNEIAVRVTHREN